MRELSVGSRTIEAGDVEPSMPLTILNVAYPLAPVSWDAVGGAEQVLAQLDSALVRSGHRSLVVACDGSQVRGGLHPICCPPAYDSAARVDADSRTREQMQRVLRDYEVDLIHIHSLTFAPLLSVSAAVPILVTLHLPRSSYSDGDLRRPRPNVWMNCVSATQRHTFADIPAVIATIENGAPIDPEAPVPMHARRFALWLGRICPEKAVHEAIEAAARADTPLLIAGRTYPYESHVRYFEEQIATRLGRACRFVGAVSGERKRWLLRHARCLLVASSFETSSLVAREALACGTPVVARRSPALEVLLENAVTGFIADDTREMAIAIEAAGAIDPRACMDAATRCCPQERTTSEYLSLYERLAAARTRPDR